jgi:lipopolysaccharide export system permease protein
MSKISKYILRASIAPFLFGTSVVIFIFLVQFLARHLDKLVGKGLDNIVIVQLIVYNIAWMVILAIPLGVLFASLMAFGNLSSNNEITIIKSSGGSLIRMMFPVFIAAGIISYVLFLYDSEVVPETNHMAKVLLYDIQRKKPTFAIEEGQFSNEIDGYTILARKKDTITNILSQVTIYDNRNMQINRTINAERCQILFSKDMKRIEFMLHNGEIFQSQIDSVKNYRQIKFDDYTLSVSASGFGFEQTDSGVINRGDREMNIADMQKIVNTANAEIEKKNIQLQEELTSHYSYLINGIKSDKQKTQSARKEIRNVVSNVSFEIPYNTRNSNIISNNNTNNVISNFNFQLQSISNFKKQMQGRMNEYEVEIQKKYAIPFACLVFILIGCPLGVITKGGNFGLSASITLGFYIVYWACLMAGEDLADRTLIDPVLSMWLGNIIIGIIGIFLTFKANNESLNFKRKFWFSRNNKSIIRN